jgi:hypothetical protein
MKKTLAYCVTCDFPVIETIHGDPLAERAAENHVYNNNPREDHIVELKTIVRREDVKIKEPEGDS